MDNDLQHTERRDATISDHELELLTERLLEKFMFRILENIGYDVTTAESRAFIREDHQWVRDWRTGAAKAKSAAAGAGVAAFVSGGVYLMWLAFKAAVVRS